MFWLVIFPVSIILGTLGISAYHHINYKHKRLRYEGFDVPARRFRDSIPGGYITLILWLLIAVIYSTSVKAWKILNDATPSNATPYIAFIAVIIAAFSLAMAFVSLIVSTRNLEHARITSTAQIVCYLFETPEGLSLRFQNCSSTASAYDVKATIENEDTSTYLEPTKPYLGNKTLVLEASAFPPSSIMDFDLSRIPPGSYNVGLEIVIHVEWRAFHGATYGGSFMLKKPMAFKKPN